MLSEESIENSGIFNPDHVKSLLNKMNTSDLVSEVDNMALTAILSTQILHDLFVKRSFEPFTE